MIDDDLPEDNGEWFVLGKGFEQICCDCGLVHVWDARRNPRNGRVEIRVARDVAKTRRRRRKYMKRGFIILEEKK